MYAERRNTVNSLPEPECKLGYPVEQLSSSLGQEKTLALLRWLHQQPSEEPATCKGWFQDPDSKEKLPSSCGPHGAVIFRRDVNRFLREKVEEEDS